MGHNHNPPGPNQDGHDQLNWHFQLLRDTMLPELSIREGQQDRVPPGDRGRLTTQLPMSPTYGKGPVLEKIPGQFDNMADGPQPE